jgi:hypothetical protein
MNVYCEHLLLAEQELLDLAFVLGVLGDNIITVNNHWN